MNGKVAGLMFSVLTTLSVSSALAVPLPEKSESSTKSEHAFFAGGCFWKTQYVFSKVPGVTKTIAGYQGGKVDHPSYEQVCSHTTGHAETVEVDYDPAKVSYHKLLEVFFANHDPTTKDRQGPDVGTNYRSAIFCSNPEQEKEASAYKEQLTKEHKFHEPIVTQIQMATQFYPAEAYHQDYYQKHGAVCF